MYAVTGASGQLGRLIIENLLGKVAPEKIVALVRDPTKIADLKTRGITVRTFNYDSPSTLAPALEGVEHLLVISSSEVGRRTEQHRAVIEAAAVSGVTFLAYTSILHADTSPLGLAVEHLATEALLEKSGVPYALLRNGWYTENYTASAPIALQHGALLGSTGNGRISAASRADYAKAAAIVLTQANPAKAIYELAGDESFTLADFAQAITDISGKPVEYHDLPEAEYKAALISAGLPDWLAELLANSSARASGGALFDDSHTLSSLIGHPTTPMRSTLEKALQA